IQMPNVAVNGMSVPMRTAMTSTPASTEVRLLVAPLQTNDTRLEGVKALVSPRMIERSNATIPARAQAYRVPPQVFEAFGLQPMGDLDQEAGHYIVPAKAFEQAVSATRNPIQMPNVAVNGMSVPMRTAMTSTPASTE